MKRRRALLFLSILLGAGLALSILARDAPAQTTSGPAPAEVTTTPAQPPPFARPRAPRKPIPLQWKLAIVAGGLVVSLGLLHFASRAWRRGNLFDRQYRFRATARAALRLGATRSGGCMATLDFRGEKPFE